MAARHHSRPHGRQRDPVDPAATARTERIVMNHPHITQQQMQRAEELVSWTRRERIRFLWYLLRMTVQEINDTTGQMMIELYMYLP